MNEMKDWFAKHLPSVKDADDQARESWVDDPAMRAKVAAMRCSHPRRSL